MRVRQVVFVFIFLIASCRESLQRSSSHYNSESLAKSFDRLVDGQRALDHARYFTQFWRIGGGPGFDACIDYITQQLQAAGFAKKSLLPAKSIGTYYTQEDPPGGPVWIPEDAVLSMAAPEQRVLHSYARTPLLLCRNSFSRDVSADLVYVKGGGQPDDYQHVDVSNKIVLCDVPPGVAIRIALQRGAVGVMSSFVPQHNAPERFPDIIAEGSIPYLPEAKPFGLKISPNTAKELKQLLTYTRVSVRVQTKSSFVDTPIKTLVAEIPGKSRPEQRIVLIAHLDHYKPGANDNASGSATLVEIVRGIASGIQKGILPAPERTLTFLWVDEYRGTEFWMRKHEGVLKDVQAAFVLDMVGGNPETTGGVFRVERMPDPGVIWLRPPDQHSGWGAGQWPKNQLKGSFLNDFYLSIIHERAHATSWKTTQNVWEGGSDHDPFLRKGIPAILSWHFPDYAYHSSMDSLSNISPVEMKNAGVSIGAASFPLALGAEDIARKILSDVSKAAAERLDVLNSHAQIELGDAQSQGSAAIAGTRKNEREVLDAWGRWYEEAFQSVLSVPTTAPSEKLKKEVEHEIRSLREKLNSIIAALGL